MQRGQSISFKGSQVRHAYRTCDATYDLFVIVHEDNVDERANTMKKRPCKNCLRNLRADHKEQLRWAEEVRKGADRFETDMLRFERGDR